jgi:hypothetical protein
MRHAPWILLIGASLACTADADAQRARGRDGETDRARDRRVERVDPVHTPDRAARPASRTTTRDARARVVYSSGIRYRGHARGAAWVKVDWGRIRYRALPVRQRRAFLDQVELRRLLGDESVIRVRQAGRRVGLRGSLQGHWVVAGSRTNVLVVSIDRFDVAEFVDYEGDGFFDDAFFVGPAGEHRSGFGW